MAECIRVFLDRSPSLGAAIAYVTYLFAQHGPVQFLTGHKSKGLEFEQVYHLNSDLIDRGKEQDLNLSYVIDTRSSNSLTYLNGDSLGTP
jgi:ATP-dependent exoDNAse (exonuclease V) beta subunit